MYSAAAFVLAVAMIATALPRSPQAKSSHGRQQSSAPKPAAVSAAARQELSARLARYLQARQEKAGAPAHASKSAKKITETREQFRARMQAERAQAKQGDIFAPRVAAYFRKQIAAAFRGPSGARVLASLRRAEPVNVRLQVNQAYPEGIPLQSMPPSLLMKLPKLPKDLEYRIVGRDLVLLDTAPNLVVDILPGALPES